MRENGLLRRPVLAGTNTLELRGPGLCDPGRDLCAFSPAFGYWPGTAAYRHGDGGRSRGPSRSLITFDVTNPAEVAKLLANDAAEGRPVRRRVAISGDTACDWCVYRR